MVGYAALTHPTTSRSTIPRAARRANHATRGSILVHKIFAFTEIPIRRIFPPPHPLAEGRIAIVTACGMGGGGRGWRRRDGGRRAGNRQRRYPRDSTTPCAYGKTVWSWRPKLASSLVVRRLADRMAASAIGKATGATELVSPGSARHKPFKPSAQGRPGVSASPVVLPL
jgi:hypothetical protein